MCLLFLTQNVFLFCWKTEILSHSCCHTIVYVFKQSAIKLFFCIALLAKTINIKVISHGETVQTKILSGVILVCIILCRRYTLKCLLSKHLCDDLFFFQNLVLPKEHQNSCLKTIWVYVNVLDTKNKWIKVCVNWQN